MESPSAHGERVAALSRRALLGGIPALALLGLAGCASDHATPAVSAARTKSAAPTVKATPTPTPTPSPTPTFDTSAHSIDDPTSIWIVVDKHRQLTPKRYVPADLVSVDVPHTNPPLLRRAAAGAVVAMFAAAKSESGVHLVSNSTYRSYDDQQSVYDADAANLGKAGADKLDMRPGYSEHQTGWAIDIGTNDGSCAFEACIGETVEGRWLAKHAWRFGFLLRYPQDRVSTTGITYEPWHFRYLGKALSTELHDTKVQTLEEFFGLPATPTYA